MEKIKLIISPIKEEFEECRTLYETSYKGDNAVLGEILQYIHRSEGKMMRPILTLLCARLLGKVSESAKYAATAYEFFHNASLVHDDVVDDSDERRGNPSVNNLYNNKRAVLVGDYLLAQGLKCIAMADNTRLVDIMSESAKMLADGELYQLSIVDGKKTEEQYLRIIRCKTAALFMACAQSGAIAVGASEEDAENMRVLGEAIGMCFQIKDDMLDSEIDLQTAERLLALYMDSARSILDRYPESDVRKSISAYIDYVVEREY